MYRRYLCIRGQFLCQKQVCRFEKTVPFQKFPATSEISCQFKNILPFGKIGPIGPGWQVEMGSRMVSLPHSTRSAASKSSSARRRSRMNPIHFWLWRTIQPFLARSHSSARSFRNIGQRFIFAHPIFLLLRGPCRRHRPSPSPPTQLLFRRSVLR